MTMIKGFISLAPWWRKKQVDILATEETLELGGKSTFSKNLNSFLKKKPFLENLSKEHERVFYFCLEAVTSTINSRDKQKHFLHEKCQ